MKKLLIAAAALLVAPMARADSELSLMLEGGAAHYNQALASTSNTGAEYGLRLGILPTPMLGVEVGYLGTQNAVNQSLQLGRNASTITTNEGYGDVRLNILPGSVTPYLFGGYGLTWISGAQASGIPNRNANTLPFGGGIDANIGTFKVGGRFQYNYLFDRIYTGNANGTVGSIGADKGGTVDFWGVAVNLGASFR